MLSQTKLYIFVGTQAAINVYHNAICRRYNTHDNVIRVHIDVSYMFIFTTTTTTNTTTTTTSYAYSLLQQSQQAVDSAGGHLAIRAKVMAVSV
jgi:hypothetical protein